MSLKGQVAFISKFLLGLPFTRNISSVVFGLGIVLTALHLSCKKRSYNADVSSSSMDFRNRYIAAFEAELDHIQLEKYKNCKKQMISPISKSDEVLGQLGLSVSDFEKLVENTLAKQTPPNRELIELSNQFAVASSKIAMNSGEFGVHKGFIVEFRPLFAGTLPIPPPNDYDVRTDGCFQRYPALIESPKDLVNFLGYNTKLSSLFGVTALGSDRADSFFRNEFEFNGFTLPTAEHANHAIEKINTELSPKRRIEVSLIGDDFISKERFERDYLKAFLRSQILIGDKGIYFSHDAIGHMFTAFLPPVLIKKLQQVAGLQSAIAVGLIKTDPKLKALIERIVGRNVDGLSADPIRFFMAGLRVQMKSAFYDPKVQPKSAWTKGELKYLGNTLDSSELFYLGSQFTSSLKLSDGFEASTWLHVASRFCAEIADFVEENDSLDLNLDVFKFCSDHNVTDEQRLSHPLFQSAFALAKINPSESLSAGIGDEPLLYLERKDETKIQQKIALLIMDRMVELRLAAERLSAKNAASSVLER